MPFDFNGTLCLDLICLFRNTHRIL